MFFSTRVVFVSYVFVVTNELCVPTCQMSTGWDTPTALIFGTETLMERANKLCWLESVLQRCGMNFPWQNEKADSMEFYASLLSQSRAMNFLLGWVEVYGGEDHGGEFL